MDYYIVNHCDRPYPRHVTVAEGDNLRYLHPSLKTFPTMQKRPGSTSMKDFGFEVEEINGGIIFTQVRPSIATYPDGRPRKWQGEKRFILPYPKPDYTTCRKCGAVQSPTVIICEDDICRCGNCADIDGFDRYSGRRIK